MTSLLPQLPPVKSSILEAIDSHAYMAQAYRRLALDPDPNRARVVARYDHERFVSHSCIAATLAVDQRIASEIQNPKSQIQNRREAA